MSGRNGARSTGSVVRRLQLGRALRELREAAGYSVETAAPRLDWSASKLSRIENGQQAVDVHGVRSMLDLYDGSARWDELIELTRQTRQKGWWRAYGLDDKGYVPLEAEATSVRDVTLVHVPGLLQTESYARAMFEGAGRRHTPEQVEQYVRVRLHRQQRLTSAEHPLELTAILDEAVLHRQVGDAQVAAVQRAHLISAAQLPSVTLQVLPFTAGVHPAMAAGFTLLGFGDLGMPDMAYIEHPVGAVHIDKVADVQRATLAFDRLRSLALSPDDSVALIERVAAQTQ
jgi:transcriptional regulator with XRE-family HTH domain